MLLYTRSKELKHEIKELQEKKKQVYDLIKKDRAEGKSTKELDKVWLELDETIKKKEEEHYQESKKLGFRSDPLDDLKEELRYVDNRNAVIDLLQDSITKLESVEKNLLRIIELDRLMGIDIEPERNAVHSIIYNIRRQVDSKADKEEIQKRIDAEIERQQEIVKARQDEEERIRSIIEI